MTSENSAGHNRNQKHHVQLRVTFDSDRKEKIESLD